MASSSTKKILFEFFSITFAVILGFLVNQWNEDRKNKNLADTSLQSIRDEIEDNQKKLKNKIEEHHQNLELITSIREALKNDTDPSDDSVSVSFVFTNSSAWETAKLTQATSYMPIETVTQMSLVYDMQAYYERYFKDYTLKQAFNPNTDKDEFEILDRLERTLTNSIDIEETLNRAYLGFLYPNSANNESIGADILTD